MMKMAPFVLYPSNERYVDLAAHRGENSVERKKKVYVCREKEKQFFFLTSHFMFIVLLIHKLSAANCKCKLCFFFLNYFLCGVRDRD